MIFAAVDPGAVNAAVAVFHDGEPVFVDDIRTAGGIIDPALFAHALSDMKVEKMILENVHAMPKQGVSSTFKFGVGFGIIRGVAGALKLPLVLVSPNQWKTFHHLAADKELARARALQRWPHLMHRLDRKKDANRAEALLIGDWYYTRTVLTPEVFA